MKLEFDVANDEYLKFIQDLRYKAQDPFKRSHGRLVLPLQKDAEGQHINVNIKSGGLRKGTLRIRRYDLRLMIYEKPAGGLVHITDFDIFDDLGSLDFGRVPFSVRPSTLVEAVEFLADPQKDITDLREKDGIRSSLLALHVLLCEGAKLSALSLVFSNVFKTGLEVPLYSWMLKLISDWKYLSKELLGPRHYKEWSDCNYYFTNPDDDDSHSYERRVIGATCQDIAKCVGILHQVVPTDFHEDLIDEHVEGECMVELYSVLVYIDGGKSGCIYGTIEVKENTTPCYYNIYHRDPTKCEYVESNGALSLEGPGGFIDASDLFEMELDLKEKDTNLPICRGKLCWRNNKNKGNVDWLVNERHSVLVKGENGYAIVFYTVIEKAVIATVEATLERNNGSDGGHDICVSGSIVARSERYNYWSEYEQKYYQSVLFKEVVGTRSKAYDQGDEKLGKLVKLGVPMPLSRWVVAVDTEFKFTIEAKLQNSVGKPLVFGSMVIKPQDVGRSEGVIGEPSDSYVLRLRVSWMKKSL